MVRRVPHRLGSYFACVVDITLDDTVRIRHSAGSSFNRSCSACLKVSGDLYAEWGGVEGRA